MNLTPLDLKKHEFKRVLRGYDPQEVRHFLDEVAAAWESLIRSREAVQGRVHELGATLENYHRLERTLNETLLAAQRIAEESRESAQKEAEILRKEAQMEGRRGLEQAEAEARALREQIRELRVERDNLFLKLRNLMEEELLRLHALRDAHADLTPPRSVEANLVPPPGAERRAVIPPPPGARDQLQRPQGLAGGAPSGADEAPRQRALEREPW